MQGSPNGSSSNAADSSGSWETTDDENTDPHGRLNPYKNSSNGRARSTGSREDHEYIKESPNTAFAQDKLNPNLKESPFAPGSQQTLVGDLAPPLPKSDDNGSPPHTSGKAGTTNHRNGALPSAANHKTGYIEEQTIGPGDSVWGKSYVVGPLIMAPLPSLPSIELMRDSPESRRLGEESVWRV